MGSREIISVKETDTLATTFNTMRQRNKNKLVVYDSQGQPRKIVTLPDIVGLTDLTKQVGSLQDLPEVKKVDRNAGLDVISAEIEKSPLLIVTDNDRPIGVLTVSDMQRELGF